MVKEKVDRFRTGYYQSWDGVASSAPPPPVPRYASGSQVLIQSEGHSLRGLGRWDEGGPFHVLKHDLSENNFGPVHNRTVNMSGDNIATAGNYIGSYYAWKEVINNGDFPDPPLAQSTDLIALGTTAIARMIPTNPLVELSTALLEIRKEGIPDFVGFSTLRDRTLRARNAGSEYLNAEFGWRPLVSEVLALSDSVINSDEILRIYAENAGKIVRRSSSFPSDFNQDVSVDGSSFNAWPRPAIKTGFWNANGALHTVSTQSKRVWCEAAFTYYLPPVGSLARKEAELAKLLGHRVTPETMWNIAPWSWGLDWFTNVGDVMHNISAFSHDGLVMPWAYIMCEQKNTNEYTHMGARMKRTATYVTCSQKLTSTRKQRLPATPYGFGLDPLTFSNRQWAILGALGLSRGTGQLR